MNIIDRITAEQLKAADEIPKFGPGDTIRVHQQIREGTKERIQIFEGVCICRSSGGINESFTVRKISYDVGVEKIFPLHSPLVKKIEVKQRGQVRRARLYYLRNRRGKAARIAEAQFNTGAKKEAAADKA